MNESYEPDLRAFLADVMHPNVADALKSPNDDRSIFNACASVEAAASGVYWALVDKGIIDPSKMSDGRYKELLSAKDGYFRIAHDAAEAQKHRRLTRASSTGRSVQKASDLQSAPHGFGYSNWGEMIFDTDKAISVMVDHQIRPLASILVYAANFIEGEVFLAETDESSALA
jgi:hypothetical protein